MIGVDVGIKTLATCSDETTFSNPQALSKGLRRLARLQRLVSRKVKGSNNRRKAKEHVAKQHYRVSCIRKDALHKCSDAITKRASVVAIEALNVAGMLKNRRLARALSDVALGELHRQFKYKCAWRGRALFQANRWFASSKTCNRCDTIKQDLRLEDRVFHCEFCNLVIDRDLNASLNLKKLAGSSSVIACGEESADQETRKGIPVKLASMKQEPNSV